MTRRRPSALDRRRRAESFQAAWLWIAALMALAGVTAASGFGGVL
ncbi:hypothetical protein GURKE_04810 [Brevundimonas phage vB_BpoS-Gurke]|uniref:Uncharacterized protein n=1 Tax=Brevundimonas phage vB_BpoS-Gurke TaxID=2948599 RepID=A0A9E7N462_9CAUD|nr:hypothetical protein GURKE_04810 [Brevundimonas phage vB_BpoS-Gurke]